MANLKNKNILLTGASSGIGEQTAYELAKEGANLVLCARRTDRLEEVKKICKQLGALEVQILSLDLSNPDSIDELISSLTSEAIQIDVLINNAGFGHSEPFIDMDFEVVENLFRVNVLGLMYLTQQLAIIMLDQSEGHIINVASLAGKVSTPNFTAYGASKGAVLSFSNALRMELKPYNIAVSVVNFGPVDTPFFDQIQGNRKDIGQNGSFTLTAEHAGKIVAKTVKNQKREVNQPFILNLGAKIYQMMPTIGDHVLIKYFNL